MDWCAGGSPRILDSRGGVVASIRQGNCFGILAISVLFLSCSQANANLAGKSSESLVNGLSEVQGKVTAMDAKPPCQRPGVCKAFLAFCGTEKEGRKLVGDLVEGFHDALSGACYPKPGNIMGQVLQEYLKRNAGSLGDWKKSFVKKEKEMSQWRQNKRADQYGVAEILKKNPERFGEFGNLRHLKDAEFYDMNDLEKLKKYGRALVRDHRAGQYLEPLPSEDESDDSEFNRILERYTKMDDLKILLHPFASSEAILERGPLNSYLDLVTAEFQPDDDKKKAILPGLFQPNEKKYKTLQRMILFLTNVSTLQMFVVTLNQSCEEVKKAEIPIESVLSPRIDIQTRMLADLRAIRDQLNCKQLNSNITMIEEDLAKTQRVERECRGFQ